MRRRACLIAVAMSMAAILGTGTALAHVVEYETSISANAKPSGAVDPGTEVRIKGTLSSERASCTRKSRIELKAGGETIDKDRTNRKGKFTLVTTVDETTSFRVVFSGKVLSGEHPHSHTCARSSTRVRVEVT
jgi:hypothetical protein